MHCCTITQLNHFSFPSLLIQFQHFISLFLFIFLLIFFYKWVKNAKQFFKFFLTQLIDKLKTLNSLTFCDECLRNRLFSIFYYYYQIIIKCYAVSTMSSRAHLQMSLTYKCIFSKKKLMIMYQQMINDHFLINFLFKFIHFYQKISRFLKIIHVFQDSS